jgi:adenine-specific DNA-methyltransferase
LLTEVLSLPTLEWIGKEKVINHHQEVPFRVLERQFSFDENGQTESDNGSGNKIIHGDNLEALKALLPEYEGRVKCIYIDPPYNTGNEGWVYNDSVSDPKIKKWLNQVVGKEGEDLSRHDKWLCMMYPRLRLLQKLLSFDGCLVISIGYHELNNLIGVCKEIFATRQISVITVQTSGGKPSGGFNYLHEYLVFITQQDFSPNPLDFCGGNARTPYEGLTLSTFNKFQRPNQTYPIFIDVKTHAITGTGKSLQAQINEGLYTGDKDKFNYDFSVAPQGCVAIWPITSKGKECVWRQIPERLLRDWGKGYIKVSENRVQNSPNKYSIQYLPDGVIKKVQNGTLEVVGTEEGVPTLKFGENRTVGSEIPTIWSEKQFFTVNGTRTLKTIFPESEKVFDYPKSTELLMAIVQATSKDNDIVLDSFAGSGTTAHAVLNMNRQDGGNRKFILVEMEDYADSITAERVRRVIKGYGDTPGTGGGFSYYELGAPLFLEDGSLNEEVGAEKLREYVWYMETRRACQKQDGEDNKYLLGVNNGAAYYFYYEKDSSTTLNNEFIATIGTKAESYLIYADKCSLSAEELSKFRIVFKKIPRDIARL